MIHAYNKIYLEQARNKLGNMFDYLVNDCNLNIDDIWNRYINSSLSTLLYAGDVSLLAGKSGIEIAKELYDIDIEPTLIINKSKEYWAGWALAYYSWYKNINYKDIEVDILDIIALYNPYHEMDIEQFCDKLDEIRNTSKQSNLKLRRINIGYSQSKLSELTGIPLRTLQQYEQKQKNINKAQAEYVISLSQVLFCNPIDLMESENE